MQYTRLEEFVLQKLSQELDRNLYYHGVHHTIDVIAACTRIGMAESISEHDMVVLKTAAVLHDIGFVKQYKGHEEISADMACEILPGYGYRDFEIDIICDAILATKIPQNPKSHLAEILCDADVDNLGRNDFDVISDSLFKELRAYNIIQDEKQWKRSQITFLENHRFFTKSSIWTREPKKQQQLQRLREIVAAFDN
jgi:predicted metal-dependent HD superfamily phosphohydrolase